MLSMNTFLSVQVFAFIKNSRSLYVVYAFIQCLINPSIQFMAYLSFCLSVYLCLRYYIKPFLWIIHSIKKEKLSRLVIISP